MNTVKTVSNEINWMVSKARPQYDIKGQLEGYLFSGNLPGAMTHRLSGFLSSYNSNNGEYELGNENTFTFKTPDKIISISFYGGKVYCEWKPA